MRVGEAIDANEQALNLWESLVHKNMAAGTAFRAASEMLADAQQEAFGLIRECHPELQGHEFVIRWKDKNMVVVK